MQNITLRFPNGKELNAEAGKSAADFLAYFGAKTDTVYAVKINNEVCALAKPIRVNSVLEPVLRGSRPASNIYRQSLCFVLAAACHTLFPRSRLMIGHSMGYSYYYTLEKNVGTAEGAGEKLTQLDLNALKAQMERIVRANLPIRPASVSYADACVLFEALGLTASREKLRYHCPPAVMINTLQGIPIQGTPTLEVTGRDFSEPYYGPLVPNTGLLSAFSLELYDEGFLLYFPSTGKPSELAPFSDIPQLFAVYKRYKHWGRTLGVSTAPAINKMIHDRTVNDFIDITELLQQKQFAAAAEQIAGHPGVRLVLMAGPSSSGKTTSSKKLSLQLRVLGYNPKVIELDSYYLDRGSTPRDADGKLDYECLESLDVAQLDRDLEELFSGKEIRVPSYDFMEGKRFYSGRTVKLERRDILLMEGIHGLNDRLTPNVPRDTKFKLYLSAVTQLNFDDHNRVPTSDNRLIRRIVRDSRFRGKSAADTIKMWDSVQRGERLYIYPFQNEADAVLNTALDYELPVLKVFADPLLRCVTPLEAEYAEAARLLRFLDNFLPISPHYVPGQSIIREFIGDSDFVY
jgi:uridine kinase